MPKILVLDGVSEDGIVIFRDAGFEVDVKPPQKPEELADKVLFVNASEIYTKGRAQNLLTDDQSDEIYELYRNRIEEPGRVAIVDVADIAANDYDLSTDLYVPPIFDDDIPTLEHALVEFELTMAHLTEAEDQLEALLAKEGLL